MARRNVYDNIGKQNLNSYGMVIEVAVKGEKKECKDNKDRCDLNI